MNSESRKEHTFVGRQEEMVVLQTALNDAISGQGRLVMLAGEPGIGKTRMAQELASHADTLGVRVLWGWCYEQEGAPPYWPWVDPVRSYINLTDHDQLRSQMGPGAADIGEVIPELREKMPELEPPPVLDPAQARFRLFDSFASFFKNAAESQPLMLVLDDLHWADKPSLLLLEFMTRSLGGSCLLVLGIYRDAELTQQNPLSESLVQLRRSPVFQERILGGLESGHVGEFIQASGGGEPSQEMIDAIYAHTEGNPFFMSEVIKLLGERGELEEGAVTVGPVTLTIPKGVLEVIGQRLNRLSEQCNSVLTTAAVVGRQIDFKQLELFNDQITKIQLLELLDEALEAHVIEDLPGQRDRYQFSHALMQQTLMGRLSASQRVRIHALAGEALEHIYESRVEEHAAELAHHFAEAQTLLGTEKLVHYSLLAGDRALSGFSFEEALAHFERGLVSKGITPTGSQPVPNEEAADLLFGLGCAQLATVERHRLSEAVACLLRAFDYYAEAGDVDRAVAIAQHPLPTTAIGLLAGATQLARRALELVQRDSHDEGRLLSQYSRVVFFEENDFETAQDSYNRALAIAHRENDTDLELRTLANAASVDTFHGNFLDSLEKSQRGLELARRVDNPRAELGVRIFAAASRFMSGDLQGAKPHLESMRDLAERLRDRYWLATTFFLSAQGAMYEGDWETARHFSDQGLAVSPLDCRCLAPRMQLEFELGEIDQSEVYLERLLDAMRLVPPGPNFEYMCPALGIPLAARVSGGTRHFEVAETSANAVLTAANSPTMLMWGARAGLGLLAVQREDSAAAADNYASLVSSRGSATVNFSLVFDRLLGLLAQTIGNMDLAAEHFEDALAFCRKAGYRPELAWSCCDYAAMLTKRNNEGDRAKANSLLDESLAISTELRMRPLLERVTVLQQHAETAQTVVPEYPDRLSHREVEVLRLISVGRSNREIGGELFISDRTVAQHVTSILNKTNSANRAEAATYASRHRLV